MTPTSQDTHDDASDITTPGGSSVRGKTKDKTELTLKFCFVDSSQMTLKDIISPMLIYLQWSQIVQEAFGNNIEIIGNNGMSETEGGQTDADGTADKQTTQTHTTSRTSRRHRRQREELYKATRRRQHCRQADDTDGGERN